MYARVSHCPFPLEVLMDLLNGHRPATHSKGRLLPNAISFVLFAENGQHVTLLVFLVEFPLSVPVFEHLRAMLC